ncbi:MAG: Gfo/Idh/MocA family oxidoreductase [Bryobacteraceae bacterium]
MRIAVVGLGFMGSMHLKALRAVPGATVAAVYSQDEKKLTGDLSSIQGNLGGPGETFDFSAVSKYRDIPSLLADPDIDAVDICLPTNLHSDTALAALRAGKHVLVEKPIALTGELADEMVAEANRSGKLLMGAQVLRFFPSYVALAAALASQEYGAVRTAVFRRRCAAPAWSKWLGDAALSGGGVFDLLIHDVDMCVKLFGLPEAVSATGFEDTPNGVDTITAAFHYRDIPSVIVTGGWHHRKSFPFSMEYTVVTDGGTFEYSSARNEANLYLASGEPRSFPLPEQDGFEAELAYFVDCCASGRKPDLCPPEESAAAVKLTLLMLESRKRNGEKVACRL